MQWGRKKEGEIWENWNSGNTDERDDGNLEEREREREKL
jgi:hypothetical protein